MKYFFFVFILIISFLTGLTVLFAGDAPVLRYNSVKADILPSELKSVEIKDYFISSKSLTVGKITNLTGHVVVRHKDNNKAYFAAKGDIIHQNDIFFTLNNSRCRIRFFTEDIITMGENSKVVIDEVSEDIGLKKKKAIYSMLKGKAMFYITRLFRHKHVLATVKTPTAVAGVRGTKFGVEIEGPDKEDRPENLETLVYCFEGKLEVSSPVDGTSQYVNAGQSLSLNNMGAEMVEITAPGVASRFAIDTNIPEPASDSGTSEPRKSGNDTTSDFDILAEAVNSSTSTENTGGDVIEEGLPQSVTQQNIDEQNTSIESYGYFTSMLTRIDSEKYFQHLYLSTSLQNLDSVSAKATDILIGKDLIIDGSVPDAPKITSVNINSDTISGYPYPITHVELGYDSYMKWGYWKQASPMPGVSVASYAIDNKGYFIMGSNTSGTDMAYLASLNQVFTYSGGAEGTYWSDTGGSDMTGSFNASINFSLPSNQISDFDLLVTDGTHTVSITNEQGEFTDPKNSSHFVLPTGTGQWMIDGVVVNTINKKNAYGSVYGPGAKSIGGVWKIDADPAHATGVFHGRR
ncbi:MAG: FecR family protein [Pseudomonadota bacterium]